MFNNMHIASTLLDVHCWHVLVFVLLMNLNHVPVGPENIQVASHSAGTGQLSDQVQLQGGRHLRYVPLALSC